MHERVDVAGAIAGWAAARSAGGNVSLEQFVPQWDRQSQRQSVDQMIAVMRAIQRKGKRGESS